jgi:hypothetical protein
MSLLQSILANKETFREDILSNRIEEIVHESFQNRNKLTGTFNKSRISNLFVGSGAFTATPSNTFQGLIVDEAHRLNGKSGLFSNLGENPIKELIDASTFTVFFLDEDQRIHWKDIGNTSQIREWAESLAATFTEMDLESQFRCKGSDDQESDD